VSLIKSYVLRKFQLASSAAADSCDPNPCNNRGQCSVNGDDFTCDFPSDWTGKTCDEEVIIDDYKPIPAIPQSIQVTAAVSHGIGSIGKSKYILLESNMQWRSGQLSQHVASELGTSK
jgi:hypothetical protein